MPNGEITPPRGPFMPITSPTPPAPPPAPTLPPAGPSLPSFQTVLPPQKSAAGLIIKIISGLIVAAVAGTGISLGTRIWDPLWNPFRPDPEKVISKMIEKMKEVKTFHQESEMELGIKNEREFNVKIKTAADSDFSQPENLKGETKISVSFSANGSQFLLEGKSKAIGKELYINLETIPALSFVQPFLEELGIEIDQIKNQWIKIDENFIEETAGLLGQEYKEDEETKKKQEEMVEKIKALLSGKKLYLAKEEMPDEKIENRNMYHYAVSLNKEEIKGLIPEFFNILEELSGENSFSSALIDKEAEIKFYMLRLQSAAEIINSSENSYANLNCSYIFKDAVMADVVPELCEQIEKETGAKPIIFAGQKAYCAYASLPVKGYYSCLDSNLSNVITNISPEAAGYCNGKTFICPPEISKEDRAKIVKEEILKQTNEFFDKIGELSAELWIGKKDYYVYRVKAEKTFDLSQFVSEAEEAKAAIVARIDMNISKFNQPLNIQAPSDYKELEEILEPILTSLLEAQKEAKDARIMADMGQIRSAAEIIYGDEGTYLNVNCANAKIKLLCDEIEMQSGGKPTIRSSKNKYCAYVVLPNKDKTSGKTKYGCIDSNLRLVETTTNPGQKGYCYDSTFVCPSK